MFVNATFEKHAYRFLYIKYNRLISTIFSSLASSCTVYCIHMTGKYFTFNSDSASDPIIIYFK